MTLIRDFRHEVFDMLASLKFVPSSLTLIKIRYNVSSSIFSGHFLLVGRSSNH